MLAAVATVLVLAVTGMGWAGYRNITGGIITSQALVGGPASVGGAQNILIMGLDSRLDQRGRPLPTDIYDELHAGDEIAQAMAFVRQRRDINDEMFTDIDRTRRQQAFIASLVNALRHGGALSSPTALRRLLDVARQNVAVDAGFDLAGFVEHASGFTDRPLSLYTLPITEFGQDPIGQDVNLVDVAAIRAITHNLTAGDAPRTPTPAGATIPAASSTQTASTSVTTVAATATGTHAPVPTDLSRMSGADTPCVK